MINKRILDILTTDGKTASILVFHPFNGEPLKIIDTNITIAEVCCIYGKQNVINEVLLMPKSVWQRMILNPTENTGSYIISHNEKLFKVFNRKYNLKFWASGENSEKAKIKSRVFFSEPDYYSCFSVKYPNLCDRKNIIHLTEREPTENDSESEK